MTEEGTLPPAPGKEPGILRTLLIWTGIGIRWSLVVILALALFFLWVLHAPLKSLALPAGIIALLAFTPKRARPVVFGLMFTVFAAVVIWVFLPEDSSDWKPLHLQAEIDAFNAKYAIPESENAAPIYMKLFADMKDSMSASGLSEEAFFGSRSYDDPFPDDVRRWWQQNHSDWEARLAEAADRPSFFIPTDSLLAWDEATWDAWKTYRCLIVFLPREAEGWAAKGRLDEALNALSLMGKMSEHMMSQPSDWGLIGGAADSLTVRSLRKVILTYDLPPETLAAIAKSQKAVVMEPGADYWAERLAYERLRLRSILASLYEEDSKGHIRRSGRIKPAWHLVYPQSLTVRDPGPLPLWKLKAGRICMWFLLPRNPDKLLRRFDREFDACQKRFLAGTPYEPMALVEREPWLFSVPRRNERPPLSLGITRHMRLLMDITWPPEYRRRQIFLRGQANHKAVLIAIALKGYRNRNGQWPARLDECAGLEPWVLEDSVNGGAFVYRRVKDGFILYSTGQNRVDDGGWGKYHNNRDCDDFLLWPERMTEDLESQQDDEQQS